MEVLSEKLEESGGKHTQWRREVPWFWLGFDQV